MENFEFSPYEWILTNSQGGYALGSANLLNHRKYHGILIASDSSLKRTHLVSSIEENLQAEDGKNFFLDANNYHNTVYPQGYKHMVEYFLRPYPSFLYSTNPPSNQLLIMKRIQLHPTKNVVLVRYTNLGKMSVKLILRPKFTLRDHHTVHEPGFWDTCPPSFLAQRYVETGIVSRRRGKYGLNLLKEMVKVTSRGTEVCMFSFKGRIESEPVIYRNIIYPTEIIRGYEGVEDLLAPFKVICDLKRGEEEILVFADKEQKDFERLAIEVENKYRRYPLPTHHPLVFQNKPEKILLNISRKGERIFTFREYLRILELAMSEFLTGEDVVAGFPWFSAWGRDTMISLEALKYIEGGNEIACKILKKYSKNMKEGIIPNTLQEGGTGRNYDTVDASLWFGIRAMEFWNEFDPKTRKDMLDSISQILANYLFNESLPFYVDRHDGLISIHPNTGLALTWMDAKVQGEPVTPRYGKPVEVNALWYNLLRFFIRLAGEENIGGISFENNRITLQEIESLAKKVKKSMDSLLIENSFADRIENGKPKTELRPNYLIAFSLPFDIVSKEKMSTGYEIAKKKLLTPYGLRSISPEHRLFRKRYMGNQRMRDLSYHQGTVWVWLLLPMAKVAAKIYSKEKHRLISELDELVFVFRNGFMQGKMSSVPELYDGEEPNFPKGAPAQCWSVAAIFLIEKMLKNLGVE